MKIYGHRLRVYGALLLFCIAIYFSPTDFLMGVLGYGIAAYFPLSLIFLLIGSFTESFRNVQKQNTVIGIPTPIFCIGLIAAGGCLTATYVYSHTFHLPRLGALLIFGGIEIYLIYHEAKLRQDIALQRFIS
jgi:hypothetical protein